MLEPKIPTTQLTFEKMNETGVEPRARIEL